MCQNQFKVNFFMSRTGLPWICELKNKCFPQVKVRRHSNKELYFSFYVILEL
jgi:hypothetical protein